MENEKQKEFILNENLWKVIFDLAWPAIIAMILLGANNVLDGIFVGHFAEDGSLAGISVAMPPIITIIGLGILVGSGAGTLLSIAIGAEDIKVQKKILGNVNFLVLILSVIVMSLGFLFSEQTLFLMGGRDKALIYGGEYYRTLLWGTPIWIYAIALNNLIRSEGKMKTAAAIMGISLIVNGCANYILMVVFNFGVKGAAAGTNIGMAVQAVIGAVYFAKKNTDYPASAFTIRIEGEIISKIISMGLAGFIMQFMGTVQMLLVLNVLNHYGSQEDIAFYGIVTRIFSFLLQPLGGFMFALSPIIGINFGADKIERLISAFKKFVFAALVLIAPFWILMLIFPQAAISLMMKTPGISTQNISYFRIYMALLPVMPLVFFALAFFPAVNKGKISAILGILQQIIFYLPVMLILPIFAGVSGIYYGTLLIEIVSVIPIFILLLREFRLLRAGVTKWQKNEEKPINK
ncbi:polysaccharide biosynthesis C-terminal domain-containing protein [Treponema sp. OMZ 787]|uniref:MATE family efflux transporter n=2 Tax=unclassified Treponema TaxID=2638727 RepID=UPI0020A3C58E|nr:MATE family efflux transporter [Treponema sp. OMZ 787]UTC63059.1 polysaccharide biosynthesis C-terminal domain-containing protein [Treponema sp. OMZ 787]